MHELNNEMNEKKKTEVVKIKEKYNNLSLEIKIDVNEIQEILKRNSPQNHIIESAIKKVKVNLWEDGDLSNLTNDKITFRKTSSNKNINNSENEYGLKQDQKTNINFIKSSSITPRGL